MPSKGGKLPIGCTEGVVELRRRAHRARLYTNLMMDAEIQAELLAYSEEPEARARRETDNLPLAQMPLTETPDATG
jgi:hypothetical protein